MAAREPEVAAVDDFNNSIGTVCALGALGTKSHRMARFVGFSKK
jgi:hypothetical protein